MARQTKLNPELADKALPRHLRDLIEKGEIGTQQKLAEHLGVTSQSISYYKSGSSSPDWEAIVKIAEFFNVSIDWLLGSSSEDVRTNDITSRQISEVTGLSDKSITVLSDLVIRSKALEHRFESMGIAPSDKANLERYLGEKGFATPEKINSQISTINTIISSQKWLEVVNTLAALSSVSTDFLLLEVEETLSTIDESNIGDFVHSEIRVNFEQYLSKKSTQIYAKICKYETAMRDLIRETTNCYETAQRCDDLYKQVTETIPTYAIQEVLNGES